MVLTSEIAGIAVIATATTIWTVCNATDGISWTLRHGLGATPRLANEATEWLLREGTSTAVRLSIRAIRWRARRIYMARALLHLVTLGLTLVSTMWMSEILHAIGLTHAFAYPVATCAHGLHGILSSYACSRYVRDRFEFARRSWEKVASRLEERLRDPDSAAVSSPQPKSMLQRMKRILHREVPPGNVFAARIYMQQIEALRESLESAGRVKTSLSRRLLTALCRQYHETYLRRLRDCYFDKAATVRLESPLDRWALMFSESSDLVKEHGPHGIAAIAVFGIAGRAAPALRRLGKRRSMDELRDELEDILCGRENYNRRALERHGPKGTSRKRLCVNCNPYQQETTSKRVYGGIWVNVIDETERGYCGRVGAREWRRFVEAVEEGRGAAPVELTEEDYKSRGRVGPPYHIVMAEPSSRLFGLRRHWLVHVAYE